MSRPLVRAVFAVLVVATIAAFFATQLLKSEFPLVIRFATKPAHFSPNGDGYRDETRVGFDLSEPAEVTFSVVDAEGNEVRRIVDEQTLAGDAKHRFSWDGRDDDGNRVPDGTYRMRVVRRDESRVIDSFKEIDVDTTAAERPARERGAVGDRTRRARAGAAREGPLRRPRQRGARVPRLQDGRRAAALRGPPLPRHPARGPGRRPARESGTARSAPAPTPPPRRPTATTPSR